MTFCTLEVPNCFLAISDDRQRERERHQLPTAVVSRVGDWSGRHRAGFVYTFVPVGRRTPPGIWGVDDGGGRNECLNFVMETRILPTGWVLYGKTEETQMV